MFRYGETKQFLRKIVIPVHCLIRNIFRYQKFSKTQKGFWIYFSVVWDRNRSTEIVNIFHRLTHLSIKCFDNTFFWNTEGFPTMFFDTARYQLFDGNVWCPLFFYPQNFSMPEIFWNIERTIYKVFHYCEKKDFQRKVVISPSYAKDVSILEFIWTHGRGPLRNISVLWDKISERKSRYTPSSFIH